MKTWLAAATATLALISGTVQASPLSMDYSVSPGSGSLYDYSFTLKLDNNDSTWAVGQGWTWIIYGDSSTPGGSPLNDFVLTGAVPSPFGIATSSYGGHNGPTFLTDLSWQIVYWTPTAVGQSLSWSGTSATNLGKGQLLFSTLITQNGAVAADYQTANLITAAVPEAESSAMMLAGLLGLAVVARRRKQS